MLPAEIISSSPEETFRHGAEFAKTTGPGEIVSFTGPLGSGKTQFIKGICSAFGVTDPVNSPTFIIVNEYEGSFKGKPLRICHFDLYRIVSESELDGIGIEDYATDESLCLVEWAENASGRFAGQRIVRLDYGTNENERIISIH